LRGEGKGGGEEVSTKIEAKVKKVEDKFHRNRKFLVEVFKEQAITWIEIQTSATNRQIHS